MLSSRKVKQRWLLILHHASSVTSRAGVVDKLAAEGSPAVVTTTASFKAPSAMLSKLRQRYLSCASAKQHVMTFGALDSFALYVDLMGKSVIISPAHCRRRLLIPGRCMAFAAARSPYLLASLNLIGSLMANIAFAMLGERGPRSRDCVAA